MFTTLLCLTLAAAPVKGDDARGASAERSPVSLDGTWNITCLEKNGKPVTEAKGRTVTVKDNTFTCTGKDGKTGMAFKVDFANKGMISITETATDDGSQVASGTKAKSGVYVLTSNVLAVCMHDESSAETTATSTTGAAATPQSKSYCTIILQREGAANK